MGYANVLVARDGRYVTITMNRPERRNALSLDHMRDLLGAFRETAATDALGITLAGAGPAGPALPRREAGCVPARYRERCRHMPGHGMSVGEGSAARAILCGPERPRRAGRLEIALQRARRAGRLAIALDLPGRACREGCREIARSPASPVRRRLSARSG